MDLPNITRREKTALGKIFKPKPIQKSDEVSIVGALGMTWYFEDWFSKLILSLAMFSLLYSIIRILVQGFW